MSPTAPTEAAQPYRFDAAVRPSAPRRIGVLFIQSQPVTTATFAVHCELMRCFDPARVESHIAYAVGPTRSGSFRPGTTVAGMLREIGHVQARPTTFGPGSAGAPSRGRRIAARLTGIARWTVDVVGLVRYVRRNRIALIHADGTPRNAAHGYLLSRLSGAKLLIHLHNMYAGGEWLGAPARFAITHADGILGVSRFVSDDAASTGLPPERRHAVLNGIDTARWEPDSVDGATIRAEFGVAPETTLIVMVSAVRGPWKGHRDLIDALERVVAIRSDFLALVVGEVVPGSGMDAYFDELKQRVADGPLRDHVVFTGARGDVPALHKAADIFALPSLEEPFGLATLEAMAMETAVVSLDSGGTPEFVRDGEDGLLSAPGEADALAANLIALIGDHDRRRRLAATGRDHVLSDLRSDQMATRVERVYRAVLGDGSPSV